MRTASPPLLPVFRSRLQGELLALLLADASVEWTVEQLAEQTDQPYQTVANEIRRLEGADLISVRHVGRSKILRANPDSPYFEPLAQLALMSFGPPLVIGEEFRTVDGIQRAFLFGSWAARYAGESGPAPHDVDVLLVGSPDRDSTYDAARRAEQRLGREVNVTIRTVENWRTATDGFTRQLHASPLLELELLQDRERDQGKRRHRE
jgi:DNA-binding transcriptional ArsR family regulator